MKPIVVAGRYRLCHILKEQQPYLLYSSQDTRTHHNCMLKITAYSEYFETAFKRVVDKLSNNHHTLKIGECGSDLIEHKKYFYFLLEERCASFLDIFEQLDRQFTQQTLLALGYHGLKALEELHQQNIVHGNINPTTLYLPLKDELRHPTISIAIEDLRLLVEEKKIGSLDSKHSAFASIGQLLGLSNIPNDAELCQKDDVESFLYVLLFFSTGGDTFSQEHLDRAQATDHCLINFKRKELATMIAASLPGPLVELYFYICSLNRGQLLNYDYWLKKIQRTMGADRNNMFPLVPENEIFEEDHLLGIKMDSGITRCKLMPKRL